MMQYEWGYHNMDGYGVFALLLWLALFVNLILLGFWLWQQINKK
jgi:hypothetical protein